MSHTGFLYLNSLRFVRLNWSQLYHVVEMLKVFTLRIKASRHFQNLDSTDQPVTAHSLKKPKTSAWSLPIESSTSLQLQDIPASIILIVLDQFISFTTSEKYLIHLSVIEPCILTAWPKNKLYSILRSQTGRLKLGYNPAKWTGSGHLRLIISGTIWSYKWLCRASDIHFSWTISPELLGLCTPSEIYSRSNWIGSENLDLLEKQ